MNSFINAICEGSEPLVNGESVLQALELANAIILSAMQERTVKLPIDRDEFDQLFEELKNGTESVPRFRG